MTLIRWFATALATTILQTSVSHGAAHAQEGAGASSNGSAFVATAHSAAGQGQQSDPSQSEEVADETRTIYEYHQCREGMWAGPHPCEPCPDRTWPTAVIAIHPADGSYDASLSCDFDVESLPRAVARAFAQVPVPAAVLSIQPPKGKTLVGLETIFSTTVEPFTRTLTLLGRRIELRITPTSFEWMHGDGTTQTSDWAGRAWDGNDDMDRYLTHTYEHTGTIHPTVTVTWTATWRLGNNPWQTVDGTVTKTGPRAELTVVEAEPELVAP